MTEQPATVSVVTGPPGVDVGPFVAWHGRDIGDGLAIRTVVSGARPCIHASPLGFAPGHLVAAPDAPPALGLVALPSAWQDPQTNLGIAYTAQPELLPADLLAMTRYGLDPGHRLTVQTGTRGSTFRWGNLIPAPVSVGNLAEAARDSVLRGSPSGSRHVLIEAGDGQTFLNALHTVGIPPWSPHIDVLDLWIVIDAARPYDPADPHARMPFMHVDKQAAWSIEQFVAHAGTVTFDNSVSRNGGDTGGALQPVVHIAVRNMQALVPGLDAQSLAEFEAAADEIVDQVETIVLAIENLTGLPVGAIGTGPDANSSWIDLRYPDGRR
jgi:hypothetical protein